MCLKGLLFGIWIYSDIPRQFESCSFSVLFGKLCISTSSLNWQVSLLLPAADQCTTPAKMAVFAPNKYDEGAICRVLLPLLSANLRSIFKLRSSTCCWLVAFLAHAGVVVCGRNVTRFANKSYHHLLAKQLAVVAAALQLSGGEQLSSSLQFYIIMQVEVDFFTSFWYQSLIMIPSFHCMATRLRNFLYCGGIESRPPSTFSWLPRPRGRKRSAPGYDTQWGFLHWEQALFIWNCAG